MRVRELSFEAISAMQEINKIIRQQIGNYTLISCGAREWRFLEAGRSGTCFRVNASNKRQFIEVELMANDTYEVTCYRLKRVTNEKIISEKHSDVYCEMLSKIIYHAVNK